MTFPSRSAPLAVILSALAVSGCTTLIPDYFRPDSPVADVVGTPQPEEPAPARLLFWREMFPDPELQRLIALALENNRDLKVAVLTVERARALYQIERAGYFPDLSADAGYSRQHFGSETPSGGGSTFDFEDYSVTAGLSAYEIDLFGRVRSLNRAAFSRYLASEAGRRAAEVSLAAEVANAAVELAADSELLQIARDTMKSQEKSLDLTQHLAENGIASELDLERVRGSIERARADTAVLEAQVERDRNALQLLVGTADAVDSTGLGAIDEIGLARDIPAGLPSDLLLLRPDVLAAENRLKAANADIGAARAAFFPSITLTASGGTASADLGDLFSGGTGLWSFAPSVSVPIFTGGRNLAKLRAAKIDRKIAVANYEKAIQAAFRDTADAFATRATIARRLEATDALLGSTGRTLELAQARFHNGVDDYLSVLDAERENYAARRELVAARLAEAANIIAIYRALGGGEEDTPEDAPAD